MEKFLKSRPFYYFYILSTVVSSSIIISYFSNFFIYKVFNLTKFLLIISLIATLYISEYISNKKKFNYVNILKYIVYIYIVFIYTIYFDPSKLIISILFIILGIYLVVLEENYTVSLSMYSLSTIAFLFLYFIYNQKLILDIPYLVIYFLITYFLHFFKTQYIKSKKDLDKLKLINQDESSKSILENRSIISMKKVINKNIEMIYSKDPSSYISYKTNILIKNLFLEKMYQNKDISYNMDISDIVKTIKNIINEFSNFTPIDIILEDNMQDENFILTDEDKFKDNLRLIFDFIKENNINNTKISLKISGQNIQINILFENSVLNYIKENTLSSIHKNSLWMRILDIIAKIEGDDYTNDGNKLSINFKKIN